MNRSGKSKRSTVYALQNVSVNVNDLDALIRVGDQ